ncbi:MAG: hypothetical protein MUF68_01945 [Cyclobacteriaceae bacterium]|jgi:hypothetical protein|nr:hypothetical protein [Cyclobacteriaceae bacterium]
MIEKLKFKSLFLIFLTLTFSCEQEQDVKPQYGKLNLGFTGSDGFRTSEIFSPTAILISIKNDKNESVLDMQRLELYNFSGQFVTSDNDKLKLPVGEYQITDLLVVNAQNQVTHVVPKSGTPGSAGVVDVLPNSLIIKQEETTKTTFVVTKVTKPASEYGYASFEVIENDKPFLKDKIKEIHIMDSIYKKYVYTYKKDGSLDYISVQICYNQNFDCSLEYIFYFDCYEDGKIAQLSYASNEGKWGFLNVYTYDSYGRVTSIIHENAANRNSTTQYVYQDQNSTTPLYAESKYLTSNFARPYDSKTFFEEEKGKRIEKTYEVLPDKTLRPTHKITYSYINPPNQELILTSQINFFLSQPLSKSLITELKFEKYDYSGNIIKNCSFTQSYFFNQNNTKLESQIVSNPNQCFSTVPDGTKLKFFYH